MQSGDLVIAGTVFIESYSLAIESVLKVLSRGFSPPSVGWPFLCFSSLGS